MNTATSLLGLLFDHTIGNILRMLAVIRLPKLERGPVSHGFVATLIVIMGYGLVMLFSASYSSGYANYGDVYHFIRPQGVIAVVGLVAMLIISNINYRALRYMNESFYIITVVLLIAALLSPEDTNGTYRWVYLAGGSFSLQPSELAKFSVMLWTATMRIKHRSGTDFSSPHCRLCRSLFCSSLSRTTRRSCCSARSSAR